MSAALLALAACTGEPPVRRRPPPPPSDTDTDTDSDTDTDTEPPAPPIALHVQVEQPDPSRYAASPACLFGGTALVGDATGSLVLSVPGETAGVAVTCHHEYYAPETLVLSTGSEDLTLVMDMSPPDLLRILHATFALGRPDPAKGSVTVWVEDPAGEAVMGARVRLDVEATGSLAHDPAVPYLEYGLGTSLPTGGTHVLFLGVPAGSVGVKVTLPTGSCTTWPGTRLVDRVPVEAGGHTTVRMVCVR